MGCRLLQSLIFFVIRKHFLITKRKTTAAPALAALILTGFLPAAQAYDVTGNDDEGIAVIANNSITTGTRSNDTSGDTTIDNVYGWYYDDGTVTDVTGGSVTIQDSGTAGVIPGISIPGLRLSAFSVDNL